MFSINKEIRKLLKKLHILLENKIKHITKRVQILKKQNHNIFNPQNNKKIMNNNNNIIMNNINKKKNNNNKINNKKYINKMKNNMLNK